MIKRLINFIFELECRLLEINISEKVEYLSVDVSHSTFESFIFIAYVAVFEFVL